MFVFSDPRKWHITDGVEDSSKTYPFSYWYNWDKNQSRYLHWRGNRLPFFRTFYYKLTQCSKINVVLSDYFSWFEWFGISLCWKKAVLKNKEPDTVMTVNQRKRKLLHLLFSLLANLYFLNWEKVTKCIMTVFLPTHCCCVYRDCNVVGVWVQFRCIIS